MEAAKYINRETNNQTTIHDLIEIIRRIKQFIKKWDKIIWIKEYIESQSETQNTSNTSNSANTEYISSELGISSNVTNGYLSYIKDLDKYKKKDLDEIFIDLNVHKDCILLWYIMISSLKKFPSKSIWIIFARIANKHHQQYLLDYCSNIKNN